MRPVIGITMGDPAGIGPEIIFKALRRLRIHSLCQPVVFGNSRFLTNLSFSAAVGRYFNIIQLPLQAPLEYGKISVVEIESPSNIRPGEKSAAAGEAALDFLDVATRAALRGEIDALVTAPVSKAAIRRAGKPDFIGHTEYLAHLAKTRSFAMMFYSKRLKVVLVTTHLALREVADSITTKKVINAIVLSKDALKKLGFQEPRIGVAGLNPHAGEDNAFGDEDGRIVQPAVKEALRRGINARGPFPADTLFHAAYNREYDLVVAMYHDQALGPFKLVAFEEGVNITLGLPFVRTSVDHGTAFDIAGKGVASERSLVEAIKLAVRLAR